MDTNGALTSEERLDDDAYRLRGDREDRAQQLMKEIESDVTGAEIEGLAQSQR